MAPEDWVRPDDTSGDTIGPGREPRQIIKE